MKKISVGVKVTGLAVATAVAAVGGGYVDLRDGASSAAPAPDEFADWDAARLDAGIAELDELIKSKAVVLRLDDGRMTQEERNAARALFERLLALRAAKLDRDLSALEKRAASLLPVTRW
jgi:hypothetical protein